MKSNFTPAINLHVENFRAINKATIHIDGISVVSGINGCGKSTLSKLLYFSYKSIIDFDSLLDKRLKEKLHKFVKEVIAILSYMINISIKMPRKDIDLHSQIDILKIHAEIAKVIMGLSKVIDGSESGNDSIFKVKEFLEKIQNIFISLENRNSKQFSIKKKETKTFFRSMLKISIINDPEFGSTAHLGKDIDTISQVIGFYIDILGIIHESYKENIQLRPMNFVLQTIQEIFHTQPKNFKVHEGEISIVSMNNKYLNPMVYIDNVIYIDTPMFFNNQGCEYWQDTNFLLKRKSEKLLDNGDYFQISNLFKNEILTGQAKIIFDEVTEAFVFQTSSGIKLDLSDAATGVKAFAVLNLLLNNGSINKRTLLILDEPEAHLHPQWITEFGRLLVLIQKYIGARIFVATHSPDMVQALRYISNKEKIGNKVRFYLAETATENGVFNFIDLKGGIENIFHSFNISLEKLEEYGED